MVHCSGVVFYTVLLTIRKTLSLNISILIIFIGDDPMYGYTAFAPAYDIAYRLAKEQNPQALSDITVRHFFHPGVYNCLDAAAIMPTVAAKVGPYVNESGAFTVLINAGCGLENQVLGDFAREWNVLALSTIGTDARIADVKRYPTALSFGPSDYTSIIKAIVLFLDQHSWKSVSMLCDALTEMPGYNVLAVSVCRTLSDFFQANKYRYTCNVQNYDSTTKHGYDDVYEGMLRKVRRLSRIIIVASDPIRTRSLLYVAHKLNMTNGDYVYLAPVTGKVPDATPVTWRAFDNEDEISFVTFQSLIFVNNPNPDWSNIADIVEGIATHTITDYNRTLTDDQKQNNLVIGAYETMTCLLQVITEERQENPNASQIDVRPFRRRFLNRVFTLRSRTASFTSGSVRVSDAAFIKLNASSGEMETAWTYYGATGKLIELSDLGRTWYGRVDSPPNEPLCGFLNNRCFENKGTSEITIGVVVSVIILLALATWRGYTYHFVAESPRDWWILDEKCFCSNMLAIRRELLSDTFYRRFSLVD